MASSKKTNQLDVIRTSRNYNGAASAYYTFRRGTEEI